MTYILRRIVSTIATIVAVGLFVFLLRWEKNWA